MVLTPKQKLVYELHRRRGMSQIDIAAKLGVAPSSICRLLARADQRIKKLGDSCPPDRRALREMVQDVVAV